MPLVMCLTNTVAANFTANVLLAIGAKPAMLEEPSEAAELAAVADAVLVNVGTLTPGQADVMRAAVRVCREKGTPWVLDPVACHLLAYRRAFVEELLSYAPTAVRGNHDEIDFLLQSAPVTEQSAPAPVTEQSAPAPAPVTVQSAICNLKSIPSLSTGETDLIRRGDEIVARVTGGVPLLQSVTATGCAQGAVCAAFLGRGLPPEEALLAASRLMKRAGERASSPLKLPPDAGRARTPAAPLSPGSFQIALLDALAELSFPHD